MIVTSSLTIVHILNAWGVLLIEMIVLFIDNYEWGTIDIWNFEQVFQ